MYTTKMGYVFECRKDATNHIGVLESYKVQYSNITTTVNITCGIDANGNLADLFALDTLTGFKRLSEKIMEKGNPEEGFKTFLRSNRPVLCVLPTFVVILVAKIVYDNATGSVILPKSSLNFYTPIDLVEDIRKVVTADKLKSDVPGLALVCRILVAGAKDNETTLGTTKTVLDAYRAAALRNLPLYKVCDKDTYFKSRLNGGA